MEDKKFASELLSEIKMQSKRWFVAFILMVVLETVTVAWFTLPVEETTKEVTVDGENGDANYYDSNNIGGDLNNGKGNSKRDSKKETDTPKEKKKEE